MKIVFLIPGSGAGFYCENCMRDIPLINALKKQDVDVTMIPIYLPLFTDEKSFIHDHGVFLGAINLYLKYKYPIMKKMPEWMSRMFNSLPFLKMAAKLSSSTEATSLEDMTMDMLTGNMPYIEKEIGRLIDFLIETIKPDIIHISNALLAGLGIRIKERLREKGLKSSLVCTLQDEHTWLDVMKDPYRSEGWETLRKSTEKIDMFFPVSTYYKLFMDERMEIPPGKSRVVHNGIDYKKYSGPVPSSQPLVIGYLSRLHRGFGLDKLADSYIRLKKIPGLENLRLRITGGSTSADRMFIKQIKSGLKPYIRSGEVRFFKEFDIQHRLEFFNGMTLLSVPMEQPEAFGIYLLEAMAAGIPVVQPDIGSFPEIVNKEAGGLYNPEGTDSLYIALRQILLDPECCEVRAHRARQHIIDHFSLDVVAANLKTCYEEVLLHSVKSGEVEYVKG